ncbi:MAG: hypothetical protein KF729_14750 [Sandaracinaceae bacterium]|nr:hypothetical protein [Sandaracinaceae bacterium]
MNALFSGGYWTLFHLGGVPVRLHWSVPLVCVLFGGLRFAPGLWLGILLVILLHELGHAFFVRRFGLANLGIDLTGIGGLCRWAGEPTPIERAWVAWGGVLAQLVLFTVTIVPVAVLGTPSHPWVAQLVEAFLWPNLFVAGFNLIPFAPFDGAEAWPLFGHLWRRHRARQKWKKKLVKAKDLGETPLEQTLRQALDEADRRKLH